MFWPDFHGLGLPQGVKIDQTKTHSEQNHGGGKKPKHLTSPKKQLKTDPKGLPYAELQIPLNK